MRHLQKLAEGFFAPGEINHLLAEKLLDSGPILTEVVHRLPALKARGRGIMAVVGGDNLGAMSVNRLDPKGKLDLGVAREFFRFYLAVLHADGNVLVMADDESAVIKSGEYWWVDLSNGAYLINNSEDDTIVMTVEVRVDP